MKTALNFYTIFTLFSVKHKFPFQSGYEYKFALNLKNLKLNKFRSVSSAKMYKRNNNNIASILLGFNRNSLFVIITDFFAQNLFKNILF